MATIAANSSRSALKRPAPVDPAQRPRQCARRAAEFAVIGDGGPMKITEVVLRPDRNNFTLVRLMLASSVIYSHAYEIVSGNSGVDGVSRWIGATVSTYGVDGFFFLSGFLVYPSLVRLENVWRFLGARLSRLWPALAFSVLLVVAGGAVITTAHGIDYLKGPTLRFILGNLTFAKAFYDLTGVDCGGAACNVNGSLWTLPWEMRCYLVLVGLGVAKLASPKWMMRIAYPATLAFVIAWDTPFRDLVVQHLRPGLIHLIDVFDRLWPLFCLGTAAYVLRARIRLSWFIFAGLLALDLATARTPVFPQVRALFIGYAVLALGLLTAEKKPLFRQIPDYSYGMYIYAFPIMMALHLGLPSLTYGPLAILTGLATLPVAAFSWHLVEKPALDGYKGLLKAHATLQRA